MLSLCYQIILLHCPLCCTSFSVFINHYDKEQQNCCSHDECVELLLKHGAKSDVEARMCWPGTHSSNCEERGKYCEYFVSK